MSSKRRLLKSSGIYGLVQILQKCIGLILIPVYTNILLPEEKGITDVVTTLVAFLSVFYSLSLNAAVMRFYVDYKDDKDKLKDFWGTCITFIMLNSIILSTFFFITKNYILIPVAKNVEFYPYIALGMISITLNPIYTIFQSTLQAKEESKKYGINNFLYFLVNLSLTILFVVILRIGAVGVLFALAITDVIFFIYTVIVFLPKVTLRIKKEYLKQGLKYSLPLLPHNLSGWAVAMIDRLFLNGLVNTAAAGVYSTAAQFGNVINVLTSAINQAYVPWFFERMKEKENNEDEIVKMAEVLTVVYCFLAMGMSLFGPEIFRVLGKEYYEGWKVIPFMSFAFVFNGMYYFFVNPLFYNKKGVKYIAIGTFSGAILNMILNLALIPKLGGVGAGLASLLSMMVSCILVYFISKAIEPLKFNIIKMFGVVIIFLVISFIPFALTGLNFWMNILVKILIVLVVIIVVAILRLEEIKKIINQFKKR